MATTPHALQLALDLVGVLVFALSGGLLGVRRGLDLFGILVLGGCTGLGGGVVRDLLLRTTPVGVDDWRLVAVAVVGGVVPFFLADSVVRLARPITVLDAAGLALFCVSASMKAIGLGASPVACVIVGVVTAIGGGMIRDVLAGVVPVVLRRELYAVPALLGSSTVVAAHAAGALTPPVVWLTIAAVLGLRLLAVARRWQMPRARPLTHPAEGDPTP